MKAIILVIKASLITSVFGFTPQEKDIEASEAIRSEIGDDMKFAVGEYRFSQKSREKLSRFSPKEMVRGIATLVLKEDEDPFKGKRSSTGRIYFNAIYNNRELFSAVDETRKILLNESSSREIFLMTRLASSVSKERRPEIVTILFNSLFRDGKVTKKEGEYTESYWDDISKFSYDWIVSSLNKEGYDYAPVAVEDAADHEVEALNLAGWLIENYPGCENYSLSDINTPVFMMSRESGQKRRSSEVETPAAKIEEESSWTDWPIIAAIVFFLGAVSYLGFKKFSNQTA